MIRTSLILMFLLGVEHELAIGQTQNPPAREILRQIQAVELAEAEPVKLFIYRPKYMPAQETQTLVQGLMGKNATIVADPVSNRLFIRAPQVAD